MLILDENFRWHLEAFASEHSYYIYVCVCVIWFAISYPECVSC